MLADGYSSRCRPVLAGDRGAIAAAHPLAVAAGQQMLMDAGSAADAAIAAQAVLTVIAPDACGVGGDLLAMVRSGDGSLAALHGSGLSPAAYDGYADDGARSITVPGIVDGWCELSRRHGRLGLARALAPAISLARRGVRVSPNLASALERHRGRLLRGGGAAWPLFDARAGQVVQLPALATLLERVADRGRVAFHEGPAAVALADAVQGLGGRLTVDDLAAHATLWAAPLRTTWGDWQVHVQPPMTQGVLLAMAVNACNALGEVPGSQRDHAAIELTQAAFAHRDDVALGEALLRVPLAFDAQRATHRGGPRAYLHTAGVAAVDASGSLVSSLVSVFDDFGSCVYVPELGCTLNNRAAGFTGGANAPGPSRRPVHTLAPVVIETPSATFGLATPGADGQVQTLLQVLSRLRFGADLAEAVAAPRWRSENGRLLMENDHAAIEALVALGHDVVPLPAGDVRFGAVVGAGMHRDSPFCIADWRRETWQGAA